MPNTREKLVELFDAAEQMIHLPYAMNTEQAKRYIFEQMADHLIANGVTVVDKFATTEQEWISSKERKPTKEDADKYGRVLVMEFGMISLVNYRGPINFPERFQHWMPLPKPPKGE